MKKIASIMMAIIMILSLSACGSSGNQSNPNPNMAASNHKAVSDKDILLEVELTPDNFYDYFECVVISQLDENGNPYSYDIGKGPQYRSVMGLKNKQYENYILYDVRASDAWFTYELKYTESDAILLQGTSTVYKALQFSPEHNYDYELITNQQITSPDQYTMQLVDCGGTLKFLNAKCIENVEIEDTDNSDWGYLVKSYNYTLSDDYLGKVPYIGFNSLVLSDFAY